jgi:Trk K+ transport system NAD-binding subunit
MNALGRRLVELLAARGDVVVAVDTDPRKLEGLPAQAVLGSATTTP